MAINFFQKIIALLKEICSEEKNDSEGLRKSLKDSKTKALELWSFYTQITVLC